MSPQGELDALFFQLFCNSACIWDGSGKAIQLWHDQHIAFPHSGQCLVKTGSDAVGPR